jgi:hypothetical protein
VDGMAKLLRERICLQTFTTLVELSGFRSDGALLPDGSLVFRQSDQEARRRGMKRLLVFRLDEHSEPKWKSLDEAEATRSHSYESVQAREESCDDFLRRDGVPAKSREEFLSEFAEWDPQVRERLDIISPGRLRPVLSTTYLLERAMREWVESWSAPRSKPVLGSLASPADERSR